MNIPPIPGLPPHPTQVAELQRLAELKRADPSLAQAQTAAAEIARKSPSLIADPTREVLKRIGVSLRKAAGLAVDPGAAGEPARPAPQRPAEPPAQKGAADRKAEGPPPARLSPPGMPAAGERMATRAPSIQPRDAN
jgi:hypothetical protein